MVRCSGAFRLAQPAWLQSNRLAGVIVNLLPSRRRRVSLGASEAHGAVVQEAASDGDWSAASLSHPGKALYARATPSTLQRVTFLAAAPRSALLHPGMLARGCAAKATINVIPSMGGPRLFEPLPRDSAPTVLHAPTTTHLRQARLACGLSSLDSDSIAIPPAVLDSLVSSRRAARASAPHAAPLWRQRIRPPPQQSLDSAERPRPCVRPCAS